MAWMSVLLCVPPSVVPFGTYGWRARRKGTLGKGSNNNDNNNNNRTSTEQQPPLFFHFAPRLAGKMRAATRASLHSSSRGVRSVSNLAVRLFNNLI